MIVVHLVIIGQNPNNNEYSIGLSKTGFGLSTVQYNLRTTPDIDACDLATKYIKAPLDWYSVRKQTFIYMNDKLHLIYVAIIPNNIKLMDAVTWYPITSLSSLEFTSEVEKDIIIEGIKI